MRNLSNKKKSPKYLFLLIFIILMAGFGFGVIKVNSWFDHHYFKFNAPASLTFANPVEIKKREEAKTVIIEKNVIPEYPGEIDTPIKKYICDKFGTFDCKTAIAISLAENGTQDPERFHVNDNGSIDVGIFQINSVHFKQAGCSLGEIIVAQKNVDCAYSIFKASGSKWGAWVTYNTGAYLAKVGE